MARKLGRNARRRELLAEFHVLFPPILFRGLPRHGNVRWTPKVVLYTSLIMFWVAGNTMEEKFSTARRVVKILCPKQKVPVSFSGFLNAQQRWWPLLGPRLMTRLRPTSSLGSAWRLAGWLVLAVDGTRFECPRTEANEQELGCAGRNGTAPQIFHTLLQHVGTGLPWDYRIGPGTESERRHLDEMRDDLPEGTMLTADAGFISYELCLWMIEAGMPFVLRIGGNRTLLEGLDEQEHSEDDIVSYWPEDTKRNGSPPLKLRRIQFQSRGAFPVVLVTNVMSPEVLSDQEARDIYESRWGIEVYFRHLKQTMDFTTIKSRTPQTAFNEHHWRLLSFWTLQRIVLGHQIEAGLNPRRFSAAQARRQIREVLEQILSNERGRSLKTRCLSMQTDNYQRRGSKTTRPWPRKKNDQPPKPPKLRRAKPAEIKKAKQLGFKFLVIL